jgi:hypothetical protein
MKERPILFSASMVRAILDGTKTQTRRVINPQPLGHHWEALKSHRIECTLLNTTKGLFAKFQHCINENPTPYGEQWIKSKYGKIGDYLWVRESCWIDGATNHVHYCATDIQNAPKKTPSIFMPRWASRIDLEIVNISVEKLQDISEEDAKAEGVWGKDEPYQGVGDLPTDRYRSLWEQINGHESWKLNPFVWVINFKRII